MAPINPVSQGALVSIVLVHLQTPRRRVCTQYKKARMHARRCQQVRLCWVPLHPPYAAARAHLLKAKRVYSAPLSVSSAFCMQRVQRVGQAGQWQRMLHTCAMDRGLLTFRVSHSCARSS